MFLKCRHFLFVIIRYTNIWILCLKKVIFYLYFFDLRGIVFKNNSKIGHITLLEIFSFLKVETLHIIYYNFKVYIGINSLWWIYRCTIYIFTSTECR